MAEKKLRRKSVTVTFSGDDDVVQHIVDSRNVKQGKHVQIFNFKIVLFLLEMIYNCRYFSGTWIFGPNHFGLIPVVTVPFLTASLLG